MKYIIAIDGGGTKTHLMLFDLFGKSYYQEIAEGSNHSAKGQAHFKKVIKSLFENAKTAIKISNDDLALVYLGLSGADLEEDFKILNDACKTIFEEVPFKIVNDAWIIMRSGVSTPYGAVAIAGTGTNSAAINQKGERAILRALSFTLGTYGGGLDIAREAMHYAFRSEELTYQKTILEEEIPKLFNKTTLSEIIPLFYPKKVVSRIKFGEITALVNECALKGDQVSQAILTKMGNYIGMQTAGVIKQVKMEKAKFPVVIGGRVFNSKSSLLLNEFTRTLKQSCPNSYIVKPQYSPVVGAYLSALDELKITINEQILKALKGK